MDILCITYFISPYRWALMIKRQTFCFSPIGPAKLNRPKDGFYFK